MNDHPEIERFKRVADLLADRGWAEANAGNLSVRLDPGSIPELPRSFTDHSTDHPFPDLTGQYFLVTAGRSRARDISRVPDETIGLIEIIDEGKGIRCHWGSSPPTSEFPAHMSIHTMCLDKRPEMKAILHTHPPHLIALSHHPDFQNPNELNTALRRMHPEVGILVPDGIAGMPYEIPGSLDLGTATRDALQKCNVTIWPMHGVVSLAPNLDMALDQIEILEKAARIYLLVLSTGRKPIGLTDKQICESRDFWGIVNGKS